jgi:Kef-type K+ transport system membrane component KefB
VFIAQAAPRPLPADHRVAFVLLGVAIILVVARLMGALALRVGQPRVVGEIVAGILLGPSIFGADMFKWDKPWSVLGCGPERSLLNDNASIISGQPVSAASPTWSSCFFPAEGRLGLVLLGTIALALFMFLVGLELDFATLKGRYRGIVTVGVGVVVIPLAGGFAIGPLLYDEKFALLNAAGELPAKTGFTLMIGAMLAVTAFPVAARILQEKGLATSPLGAVGIAAAAIVTVLMFLTLGVATGVAKDAEGSVHVKRIVGTVVYLLVMWFVVRFVLGKVLTPERLGDKLNPTFFVTAVVVVLLSAYAADRIGINAIVGGFMAGIAMPRVAVLTKGLQSGLTDVTISVLLPVFLAVSGLNTNFRRLGWDWAAGLTLFIVVAIVAKWGGGYASGRIGGLNHADSNVLGVLMNCRGLLVLVVALAAKEAGVITDQMQVGAVLMALITTAMTGPLVDKFVPRPAPASAGVTGG